VIGFHFCVPPNQALKWTAPVASLGVRPLSYCR
jgi:hypothetical protein